MEYWDEEDFESQYADDIEVLNEFESQHDDTDILNEFKRYERIELGDTYKEDKFEGKENTIDLTEKNSLLVEEIKEKESFKRSSAHLDEFPEFNGSSTKGYGKDKSETEEDPIYMTEENCLLVDKITQDSLKRSLCHLDKYSVEDNIKKQGLSDSVPSQFLPASEDSQVKKKRKLSYGKSLDIISITNSDGLQTYLSIMKEVAFEESMKTDFNLSNFLSIPINVLKQKVLEETIYKYESQHRSPLSHFGKIQDTNDKNHYVRRTPSEKENETLWVEEYRPHQYMELLSDDGINRTLLQWLKQWDKVVFGREIKKRPKLKPTNKKVPQNPKFRNRSFGISEELDEHHRPQYKVALLTGYPGLGKTTLAHVIAHHAGYKVVEMNASDDRSPEFFRNQLEASTQMKAMLGEDPRPNCLIIDEIDGAPLPSINLLVSLVKSTGIRKGKKKKDDFPLLRRPIICICNDQYTPSLKPLRQISLILNFPPTATTRLVSRLQEVSKKQHLKTDMPALLALCEKAENDIRSCLSTLQFIYKQKKQLLLSDVRTLTVGQKDTQKSLFSIWQKIFQIPQIKRKHCTMNPTAMPGQEANDKFCEDNTSFTSRFYNILWMVQRCGEYEKLIQGMFENYPLIKFRDSHLQAVGNGMSWLCFTDLIQKQIYSTQLYSMLPYVFYAPIAFHLLFAVPSFPKIIFPSAHFEFKMKEKKCENILTTLYSDMSVLSRCFLNKDSTILNLLPSLLYVIQPNLRPVNTQLYTESERNELNRVIGILIDYNVNYMQQRTEEGTYEYVLEPNIEDVVKFPGIKSGRTISYAAKQLIAKEVELEKMRHNDTNLPIKETLPRNEDKITDLKDKFIPKVIKNKPALDFFGRQVKTPEVKNDDKHQVKKDIWFHFKEGYSNAVRKTVRIHELL